MPADPESTSSTTLFRALCFYTPPDDNTAPEYISETKDSLGRRNYAHTRAIVPICSIRGHEKEFSLSKHSFAALPGAFSATVDFELTDSINNEYLPWVKSFLMSQISRSTKVVVFDYCLRRASAAKTPNRQVHKIHIDQSPKGAYARAQRHLSESDVGAINTGEAQFKIINAWKPINRPVSDHPLAFLEFDSLDADDLVPVSQVYETYVGETYAVKHNPAHRFRYWSHMDTSDVLLLQCFDSQVHEGGHGKPHHVQCAHGSFTLVEAGDDPCERESIEVRCIVVTS